MLKNLKNFNPSETEEKVLKFWRENQTFEKSVNKKTAKGDYVFYDGPPFANGLPHFGNILASVVKDAVPRYQTMRGKRVERRWGWDCHGLPVEYELEKELNLKSKKEIEKFGIRKFNEAARESVLRYAGDWKKIISRLGRWADMEDAYKTMDPDYTESVWWVFKKLYENGLIYEGHQSMHICPRCETTLSNFEVAQGYKEIPDSSVIVKFELVDEPNTFLLAWTTTPWTLPGNVALAINKNIEYVKIKSLDTIKKGAYERFEDTKMQPTSKNTFRLEKSVKIINNEVGSFILSKEAFWRLRGKEQFDTFLRNAGELTDISMLGKDDWENIECVKGENLIGKRYRPLFNYYLEDKELKNRENGWKIYGADFVNVEEGTGIVHIAPAFGEDDLKLAQKEQLPIIQHVGLDGRFKPEVRDFAALAVKPKENPMLTDRKIIDWLAGRGELFSQEEITHSYPFCWRCETPLLNYAASSWFVKTTVFKKALLDNNKKINWIPEHIKKGRFGKWLEEIHDWSISRFRFWGAPLPVWQCEKCRQKEVIGSIEELSKNLCSSGNVYFLARHGQAENNLKKIVNCWPEKKKYHLTLLGRKQIEKLSKQLVKEKIDLIFSSDLMRTKETAEILKKSLVLKKVIYDKRLREINVGDFNERPEAEYHGYFGSEIEKFTKQPPKGETLAELRQRLFEFVRELEKKYKNKKILVVSHEYSVWMLESVFQAWTNKQAAEQKKIKGEGDYLKQGEFRKAEFRLISRDQNGQIDFHRPYIDELIFDCQKCGGQMKRISDIFDCWFESGAMPYGQAHYPFENKEKFEKNFPAEFIAEGIDQTRGWFYTLLALSAALFNKPAYKNVVVNGIILAEDGQKMSKHLKNYPDPMNLIVKYGADALRFYLLSSPVMRAEDLKFSEKGVDEIYKKVVLRLWNVYKFYEIYKQKAANGKRQATSDNLLDKWILAKLNLLIEEISSGMDSYQIDAAARPLNEFIDDLSNWYLRRSRRRFQKSENQKDFSAACQTLSYVLLVSSKLAAPFIPFFSEAIYQSLRFEIPGFKFRESVHLEDWPKAEKKLIDKNLLKQMAEIRRIASLVLTKRAEAGIKVRQPLLELKINPLRHPSAGGAGGGQELRNKTEILNILKDEINVKEINFDQAIKEEIELNIELTPELREEGILRELCRLVQDLRQDAGCQPADKIILMIDGSSDLEKIINRNDDFLEKEVNARDILFSFSGKFKAELNSKIDGQPLRLGVRKIK